MFAVPEYTVLRPLDRYTLSPIALIRWASAVRWHDLLSGAGSVALPYRDPRVRIWISRLPSGGEVSTTHRYDAPQGAFAVLSGAVVEHADGTARTLRPGQARVFGAGYRHTVHSGGPEPAIVVHVQIDA